jgi:hypothetical protein
VLNTIVEAIISFITLAALFYIAPGTLGLIKVSAPTVTATTDAGLNSSVSTIGGTVSGGLSISSVAVLLMGMAILIGGFMLIKMRKKGGE